MTLNASLLRSSFDLVIERQPELTKRFYEIMFDRYPQVRPLFGKASPAQPQMLQQALVAVVEHVEDATWLTETLGAMGRKHIDYGVTEEMYGYVTDSLLSAIGEAAGADFTPEVERAWRDALNAVSSLMIAGARAAA